MAVFDAASITTIGAAVACFSAAALLKRTPHRLLLILVAALLIRIDPARQTSLHEWDEQFHAVVAKHLMAHPLKPTLYERPMPTPATYDWTQEHVWLHKPPLAMWFMALSMKVFGVSAFAMRLPSVLLSTAAVFFTFLIGRRLFGDSVGLLAAAFQAVNGLLVSLASGRRVADHVDTALLTCVELAMLFVFTQPGKTTRATAIWSGAALGAAFLAKSFPAFIIIVVAGLFWGMVGTLGSTGRRLLSVSAGTLAVAGPWLVYAWVAFPVEQSAATAYTLRHLTETIEGHGGPFWMYLADMPRFFGEMVFVPLVWFVYRANASGGTPLERALLTWLIVPYCVFSCLPTKMPAFIAVAAPPLFIIQALFWTHVRKNPGTSRFRRVASAVALILLLLLPARNLLGPTGVFDRRDRAPMATAGLMELDDVIGASNAVIFNASRPYEAMFYSRYDAYARLPNEQDAAEAERSGSSLIVMVPAGGPKPDVPGAWNVRFIADPGR